MAETSRRTVVLLVDDSPSDRRIATDALLDSGHAHELHWVADGLTALAFLRREGEFASAPRPDLVLLDLRMPGLDGGGVLEEIYRDPELRSLAVVVQTSSDSDVDLVKAWELGALHFIRKPLDAESVGALLSNPVGPLEASPW